VVSNQSEEVYSMANSQSRAGCFFLLFLIACPLTFAQESNGSPLATPDPVDTQLTIQSSPAVQQQIVRSVLYLKCGKTNMKGTAFLLSTGVIVSAAHIACGCGDRDIMGTTTSGQSVTFSTVVRDEDRDLMAMVPTPPLTGGLELASASLIPISHQVNTWGFPLIYNGPAPLMSVGYVSGYYQAPEKKACDATKSDPTIAFTHIVVNGAFNPGNSGGPLFEFGQDKVIGVVIWKRIAFTDQVRTAITGFHNPRLSTGGTFNETLPDGTTRGISDQEVLSRVLEEFYEKVQVDIGEAVSVSEIRLFLRANKAKLLIPKS
jgi:S1-C subfamily serine protease